jgi:hypothetical protein
MLRIKWFRPGLIICIIRETAFKTEKLYLDCIDDQGNCFIIYRAKVKFFLLNINYSGVIFCDNEGVTIEKSSLKKTHKPVISRTISYKNKFLKTGIILYRIDDPISRSLYRGSKNSELIWNCHHPKALAEIISNGKTYKGLGYAETLFCPVNPLMLPMEELRWGRFLSQSHTVIWIKWKDEHTLNKIFLNGSEYNDAFFENEAITFNDGKFRLNFSEIKTIRNGKLSGLFSKMKLLKILFKNRLLDTVEIKYKAKTVLTRESECISAGWSLFEIVTWGK